MQHIECEGMMYIGDPHISNHRIGRRIDHWYNTIMGKMEFLIQECNQRDLCPVILGDLFHKWFESQSKDQLVSTPAMLSDVIQLLGSSHNPTFVLAGNHDVRDNVFSKDSMLAIIDASKSAVVMKESKAYAVIQTPHSSILLGGTPYGAEMPLSVLDEKNRYACDRAVWLIHRNIQGMGTRDGVIPYSIDGVDLVMAGHIHRTQSYKKVGDTTWVVPGNISRISIDQKDYEPRVYIDNGKKVLRMLLLPVEPIEKVMDIYTPENIVENAQSMKMAKSLEELFREFDALATPTSTHQTQDLSIIKEELHKIQRKGGMHPDALDIVHRIVESVANNGEKEVSIW